MFTGGIWFRSQRECENVSRYHIPEGQFKWFIDIVSYLKFVTGETVSTVEFKRDKVHATKIRKIKGQYIVI